MILYSGYLLILTVAVQARPQADSNQDAKIIRYDNDITENGYNFQIQTSNDIVRVEKGKYQPISEDQGIMRVEGYASFHFPDGTPFSLTYDADENGYRPKVRIGLQPGHVPTAAIASIAGGGIGK